MYHSNYMFQDHPPLPPHMSMLTSILSCPCWVSENMYRRCHLQIVPWRINFDDKGGRVDISKVFVFMDGTLFREHRYCMHEFWGSRWGSVGDPRGIRLWNKGILQKCITKNVIKWGDPTRPRTPCIILLRKLKTWHTHRASSRILFRFASPT